MFTTRDGTPWEPEYITAIDGKTCIGCGRCFKVCSRDVMKLMGVNEDGELVACAEDEDDDDEEFLRKVMVLHAEGNCIGCGACYRVCPKGCQTHAKASALAAAA
ncbi:ferredoxin III, nif-specific [Blastochloris sulfoviridis]|uniref:Ferredoxin III n=1 Tax=Blastochloris sulfoviridis TaxID=50712 RepID=A0A5M6I2C7_9HYPH|nr:ferredoxin III, nif-specific [Blastochloris sulfoviridis]KAA5602037.1 ferredoxin III, nif-specific [Blastochloris sulfoviridis]